MDVQCDVLVVGAGPAGASAARAAAEAGSHVLLVDRRERMGLPVQCAEYIPIQLLSEIDLSGECIAQPVRGMKTFLPSGDMRFSNSKGYMVHRDRFDRRLVDRAVEAGAKLLTGTRVLRRDPDGSVQARRSSDGNSEIRVSAKVVIGADGPCSCVGSWVNARNINLLPGVQYTMPLKTGEDCTEVYFSPEIFGGYGWFFPKGDRVNIGIGMRRSDGADVSVRKLLDDFVDRFVRTGRVENRVLTTAGGWIPAESLRRAVYGDVILAGDAAGHTHPITGAGIFAAVMCGKMAGRHAAHSVCEENPELLECYDEDWQGLFGKTLSRAFFKRVQMETGWDDLENTVRKTWVAFREYYAD